MKGKALRKHSLHGKTAASVLLGCASVVMKDATGASLRMSGTPFSNVNNIQTMIPEDQKNITTQ